MNKLSQWIILGSALVLPGVLFAAPFSPNNTYEDPTYDGNAREVTTLGTSAGQQDSFVNVVKWWVNWVLGILALIALLYLMRGGFQMVTSGGDDEKYGAWFTILKHGATWLILIGVAWFVISIIFWLVAQIAGQNPGPAGTGS